MKKLFYIFCTAMLVFTSCRYDEPSFSFQSPENRLVGYWQLDETYLNGEKVDTSIYNANIPTNTYYSFHYHGPLLVTSKINNVNVESRWGSWEFVNKNRDLNIFLILYNKTYNYKADIIKLSNKELKYKYSDPQGDEWTLHFFKR